MKSWIVMSVMLVSAGAWANPIAPDCTFNGKPLYGPVQIVERFPDIKVKVVDHFADLHVKETPLPRACGEWKIGASPGALRVKFVDHFPDITVKFVDHFPGRR